MVFTPVVNCEFYRRRAEDSGGRGGVKTEADSDTGLSIHGNAV
jgi:hypothetical protein